ncbi:carboxylesterase/lipase family protein [Nocardia sp. NPDC051570]|uniref:carboxylesterase/lipase family protein n=1 Tax=Nocardia sp. NPDC051570 TaxID=3364324 RepID=UPI003797DB3D
MRSLATLAAVGVTLGSLTSCGTTERGGSSADADAAVVDTQSGPVRGTVTAEHRAFTGIPYAAAPVDDLRWQPPAAPAHWSGTRDATAMGAQCPQSADTFDREGGSEDCLFLNVWTPARAVEKKRPVMVWVPGGAFRNGSGNLYDPSRLVTAGDMVVVTLNYRLGALGFLAHPALAHDDGQVGNFGLMDQQAALRWVRDNITAFGGDPTRVTLAGQSAGAMAVCDDLVSPASAGLFHAAIMESGPCSAQANRQTAVGISEDYATKVGCPGTDPIAVARCLRALPIDTLLATPLSYDGAAGEGIPGPVTGQPLLPENPIAAMREGKATKVPVLIGNNHDEFTTFLAQQYGATKQPDTAGQYLEAVAQTFGRDADKVTALYPLADYPHPTSAEAAVFTDYAFACPIADMANSLTHTGPVYAYEFDDRNAAAPTAMPTVPFPLGAGHAFEMPYLFHVTGFPDPDPATTAQQNLSTQMINYWAAFVNTVNPHTPNQPDWPLHTDGQVLTLQPDDTTTTTDFTHQHHCDLWATIPMP